MAFLYPSFLFALAATAIPVILHLVQLRRAKRVAFSNVRFIKASQEVTASHRKLKDLLILLCRILFVSFLVLAFAQPFIPGTAKSIATDKDVAVIVDNSFSMQNRHAEQDESLLTFAAQKAQLIFDVFPTSAVFSVLDNSSFSANRFASGAEATVALNKLDYSSDASFATRTAGAGHVFLMSDFQKNNFSPSDLSAFGTTAQVHILPIEAGSAVNVFIDTVYLEDAFVRAGGESTLHVKLYNTSSEKREAVPLKFVVDDQQVAALTIDLPAKQPTEATINFKVGAGKVQQAYVTVDDFPVDFDNTYFFVLRPSEEVRVVEVTDGMNTELEGLYSKEPLFNYTRYSARKVDYARLSEADVVLLNGIKEVSAPLATTITNFVQEGGTVMVIPPASDEVQGYDNLFSSTGIPARLTVAGKDSKTELLPPAPDNPFFKGIFAEYDKKMQMPSASRSLHWSRGTEDVLKYRGGAPFISRFDRGKGQVYLMAAPLQEDYSSLVNHALLLPVLYKVVISGYRQELPLAYTFGDNTIKFPITSTSKGEGIYKLQMDSVAFIPEQQIRGGNLFMNIPPDLNEAGVYDLTLEDRVVGTVAFNYDNKESFLEQYTPEELRSMIGSDRPNIHVYDYGDAFSVKNEFEKRYFGVKLWKYCLILCLFFLMAEIALIRFL